MDALPTSRPPWPPSRRKGALALALLLGLSAAAGSHADPASRFDLKASIQASPASHAGGAFRLDATLAPAHASAEGGGYAIEAVAAPAAACASSADTIFTNGFEAAIGDMPAGT